MPGLAEVANDEIPDPMPDPMAAVRQRRAITRDETRETLKAARDRITGRIESQGNSSKWLALASGMLSPTRTGSFGESVGQAAGLMGVAQRQRRAESRANESELLSTNQAISGLDQEELDTELALSTLRQRQQAAAGGGGRGLVQSSDILPDGTTVVVYKDGSTEVVDSEGNELDGADRTKAIKTARSYGAEDQGDRSRQREEQKSANEEVDRSFESIGKIKENMFNIDDAIAAIDEGAITGVVANLLPSFRESSIKLDHLQKKMGLDIVGSVTFGALSKGELDLAKAVAIPKDMQPQDLRKWLIKRKAAQQKLMSYLEDQVMFLGQRGNTKTGWMELQKSQRETRIAEKQAAIPPAALEYLRANPKDLKSFTDKYGEPPEGWDQ